MSNNAPAITLRDLVIEEMCQDYNYIAVWMAYRCQHDPTVPYILAELATEPDSAKVQNLIDALKWNVREHALTDNGQIEYRMKLPRGEVQDDGE